MLDLFFKYFKKLRPVFLSAAGIVLLYALFNLAIPGLIYIFIPFQIMRFVKSRIDDLYPLIVRAPLTFSILYFALNATLFLINYYFLPIMLISIFVMTAEIGILKISTLGERYSFIKFLMNPKTALEVLRTDLELDSSPMIIPGFGDFVKMTLFQYINADMRWSSGHHVEELRQKDDDLKTLRERQAKGIDKLPPQLRHLNLKEKFQYDPNNPKNLQEQIHDAYMKHLGAPAKKNEPDTGYLKNLSEEQKNAISKYLERKIHLEYDECCLSLQRINECENPQDFIILEKHYIVEIKDNKPQYKAVPSKSNVFLKSSFDELFFARATENDRVIASNPLHPKDRDLFFPPNEDTFYYRFWNYETVKDHPLSLELCEAIELLNALLPKAMSSYNTVIDQLPTAGGASKSPFGIPTKKTNSTPQPPRIPNISSETSARERFNPVKITF